MNAHTTVAVVNIGILVFIAAVTISGFVLIHSANGLWSLFALFGWMTVTES